MSRIVVCPMEIQKLHALYAQHPQVDLAGKWLKSKKEPHLLVRGLYASARSMVLGALFRQQSCRQFIVADDLDSASYLFNDLQALLESSELAFFPSSYTRRLRNRQADSANEILRTETLNRLANNPAPCIVVTYPEALMEKVVTADNLKQNTLPLRVGGHFDTEALQQVLQTYGFQRVDFVYEPGQYAVRGSIVDIFSYSCELPYRIDFFGDEIDSIRIFDIETQLSQTKKQEVEIVPDMNVEKYVETESILEYLPADTLYVFDDLAFVCGKMDRLYDEAVLQAQEAGKQKADLAATLLNGNDLSAWLADKRTFEMSRASCFQKYAALEFHTEHQQLFHKNFDLITASFKESLDKGYQIFILSDSVKQTDRIASIFEDMGQQIEFTPVDKTLHEGFIDHDKRICCYTDHQIFERFHKAQFRTDKTRQGKAILTLKELNQLRVGDFVVHVDHGIGKFGGLVRTNVNGKMQEMVKLVYRGDDIIFVSIHALHRISKYKGKEGEPPKISKLGSGAWERLKDRTKSKVKDIARELIQLYAKRKAEKGFRYSPDSFLQHELEASFIYEDTPDQIKATMDFKKDMESDMPMDRLVCGDVGFGKTEIAMRAAFKAVCDDKQVVVLVPTTVLALQHYHSFKERFKNFPCTVDYLSRARTSKETKDVLERLASGELNVIIGTHKLVGKNVKFKDLGLLIVDEEQKFGVAVKEKLKELKVNVDTMTLTATPIPRTLQFSLLGARDLSVMTTPPPNRYPVQTEIISMSDEDIIREAIENEMARNGQVFFINNRIQNLFVIENMVKRLVPHCRVAVGHGQMPPEQLENVLLDFINYEYDVLVATSIVESGVDIPNVNTIIINSAHHFGLSDLHQLRGRVGRSNRKAYCYLIAPDRSLLTPEARRRLQAIETFADLGSGFNLAMQDLDIRGAGNMLGAEQSGFIADLGYETYQKILNEAVLELKEDEFSDLYQEEFKMAENNTTFVTDCQLDTDMEIGFPMEYIENTSERISLYRELDAITNPLDLQAYKQRLVDRFGTLPPQGEELLVVVQMRWAAMRLGCERLILKGGRMILHLVSNVNSAYYQSETFGRVLNYMVQNPRRCQLREQNGKRSAVIADVTTITEAWKILSEI